MNAGSLLEAGIAFTAASAVTTLLVALAPRVGLVDDASDAPDRKHHRQAIPLVGGIALALAIAAVVILRGEDVLGGEVASGIAFSSRAVLWALACACATGLADDLAPRGLPVLPKLAGQIIAGCLLARGLECDGVHATHVQQSMCVFAAVLAQNAANTFDNADGVLTGVASIGLACAAAVGNAPFVGATLAFLPWSLPHRAQPARAWLGDSGSHLLGILLLVTPVAWVALLVPVFDLARVAILRARARVPIWRGDRRHLAHGLQDRGFGPWRIVLVFVLAALPALVWAAIQAPRHL